MATEVTLTKADGTELQADVKHIATQVNAELDIPWIPEGTEQIWIEWGIGKIITLVPPDLLSVLVDAADGLTPEEIAKHTDTLVELANQVIDLPYVPEVVEASLIRPVVSGLFSFLVQGKALSLQP